MNNHSAFTPNDIKFYRNVCEVIANTVPEKYSPDNVFSVPLNSIFPGIIFPRPFLSGMIPRSHFFTEYCFPRVGAMSYTYSHCADRTGPRKQLGFCVCAWNISVNRPVLRIWPMTLNRTKNKQRKKFNV